MLRRALFFRWILYCWIVSYKPLECPMAMLTKQEILERVKSGSIVFLPGLDSFQLQTRLTRIGGGVYSES